MLSEHLQAGSTDLLSILNPHMKCGAYEKRVRDAAKARRERLGWHQATVVERLKDAPIPDTWKQQGNISKYENCAVGVDLDTHIAIAEALGLTFVRVVGQPAVASIPEPGEAIVAGLQEAIATKKLDPKTALDFVNTLRRLVGLPDIALAPERRRGRKA